MHACPGAGFKSYVSGMCVSMNASTRTYMYVMYYRIQIGKHIRTRTQVHVGTYQLAGLCTYGHTCLLLYAYIQVSMPIRKYTHASMNFTSF
jgi:hypothetical protein